MKKAISVLRVVIMICLLVAIPFLDLLPIKTMVIIWIAFLMGVLYRHLAS